MSSSMVRLGLIGLAVWSWCGLVWGAGDAELAYEKAQQLVAAGDLAAARKSLVTAVKSDGDNQRYVQQYLLVSQAMKLEQAMKSERDLGRWETYAQSLSLFYKNQGVLTQALPIDAAIHERLQTTDAAVQYCETLLEMEQYERAVQVLRALKSRDANTSSQALLGIALARQGSLDEALKIVTDLRVAADADPFTLYLTARAQSVVGEGAVALATLRRCYESVPPSRLDALKTHTKECSEFAALASGAEFADVLRTQSKVPESKCSGGSSCSNCPMRGKCSHGQ